jgi:uncharacterized phage protein gp47/JayE
MTFYTYAQLANGLTIEEARETVVAMLVSLKFRNAASWQSGSWPLTLGVELPALCLVQMRGLAAAMSRQGFNETAEAEFSTIFSKSHYDNDRLPAVRTRGTLVLTNTGAIPYNLDASEVVAATLDGKYTYRNVAPIALEAAGNPNATRSALFEAELAGFEGNQPTDTIRVLNTTLAGVTVNNPGSWITQVGAEAEETPQLRLRNSTKWASLAVGAPGAAYEYWARSADPAVKRVWVDDNNPLGPGTLKVWVASDGPVDMSSSISKIVQLLDGTTDGHVRPPIGALVSVGQAVAKNLPVVGVAYIAADYQSTAIAAMDKAIKELYRTLPIGGIRSGPEEQGMLPLSSIYGAIMKVPGVVNFKPTTPSPDDPGEGDQLLEQNEYAVLSSLSIEPRIVMSV